MDTFFRIDPRRPTDPKTVIVGGVVYDVIDTVTTGSRGREYRLSPQGPSGRHADGSRVIARVHPAPV